MRRQKTINELAEEVGGLYALVVGLAKRAKQLKEGRARVTDCASSNVLTVALKEMLEGKVVVRPAGDKEEPTPVAEAEATALAAEAAATEEEPEPAEPKSKRRSTRAKKEDEG